MDGTYAALKFLHVVGAMLWFGSVVVLTGTYVRAARLGSGKPKDTIAARMIRLGMIVAVLAGIGMSVMRGGMQLWEKWGVVVWLLSLVVMLVFVRRYGRQLARDAGSGSHRATVLAWRLAGAGVVNVLLLLTAVWAMVYKPVS